MTDAPPESEPPGGPLARWIGIPDFEAFAAAIAATPRDQAPRLVLADWFQEREDDRSAALARNTRFALLLAYARFEKAGGANIGEAMTRVGESMGSVGETMMRSTFIPMFRDATVRMRLVPWAELHGSVEKMKPARKRRAKAKQVRKNK